MHPVEEAPRAGTSSTEKALVAAQGQRLGSRSNDLGYFRHFYSALGCPGLWLELYGCATGEEYLVPPRGARAERRRGGHREDREALRELLKDLVGVFGESSEEELERYEAEVWRA